MTKKYTNQLVHESSPYLLQHAHNPVNWQTWSEAALTEAKNSNKLIIISIGYSACHWCHVMEHESFEDEVVAEIMNQHYINIKVDREERPDLDQVYMKAVQVMTGSGGWPMNIVALPDGRPVWGGTYFKKEHWKNALTKIQRLFKEDPNQLLDYAERLVKGLKQIDLIPAPKDATKIDSSVLHEAVEKWRFNFDHTNGGSKGAPKFMMPNNLSFLFRYAYQQNDKELMEYVKLSLDKITYGGTYDHVGGGFSRYSVDERWHIPHFEKMLYDNAQLISLYSKAYAHTGNIWYKEVVEQSLNFIKDEFTDTTGAFYSAWDADSLDENKNLEEGAYFVWQRKQLETLLQEEFPLFQEYYNINRLGNWEHENYVLLRTTSDKEFALRFNLDEEELREKKQSWLKILKQERQKRPKPGLDDKSLTSWNAMMITGYIDAYKALGEIKYLESALKNAEFIISQQLQENGTLFHSYKDGKSNINGFLEDYAFCIEAFIGIYQATFNEKWLHLAKQLSQTSIANFYNEETNLFYFTAKNDEALITRSVEVTDNVIPASNSVMANNLFMLGNYFGDTSFLQIAENMLKTVSHQIIDFPIGYSNWMNLILNYTEDFYEVVVTGTKAEAMRKQFSENYIPNALIAGSDKVSSFPLLQDRVVDGEQFVYLCTEGKCQLPSENMEDVIKQIKHSD